LGGGGAAMTISGDGVRGGGVGLGFGRPGGSFGTFGGSSGLNFGHLISTLNESHFSVMSTSLTYSIKTKLNEQLFYEY